MGLFDGRTVLVTGASLGVGRACVERFHREGASVVLVARRPEPLHALADDLGTPERVMVAPADVADLDAMEGVLDGAVERFGRLDGLVNNAGLHHRGNVTDVEPRRLAAMVDVNLRAPIALTTMALPHLRAAATGATKSFVIQIASLARLLPVEGSATYSATKFGLRAFSLALAEELGDGPVTVGLVSPGPVDTGFIMADIEATSDLTFSQPLCTAAHVADLVFASALDGRRERRWPELSAKLGTFGYLFPGMRRLLKPALIARGRRVKERLLAERGRSE